MVALPDEGHEEPGPRLAHAGGGGEGLPEGPRAGSAATHRPQGGALRGEAAVRQTPLVAGDAFFVRVVSRGTFCLSFAAAQSQDAIGRCATLPSFFWPFFFVLCLSLDMVSLVFALLVWLGRQSGGSRNVAEVSAFVRA